MTIYHPKLLFYDLWWDISLSFKRIPLCASKVHKALPALKYEHKQVKNYCMHFSQLSSLSIKELEKCSILQWLPISQEKFLEVSSCEDIKRACILFLFFIAKIPVVEEGWCESWYICPLSSCRNWLAVI